jgi:hypothetical protein
MKLWLVGGDDRQLTYLAEHMAPDSFVLEHWYAAGEKSKTRRQVAPDGTTHILLLGAHCYNVMAKSAREEHRRLEVPFSNAASNPEMVETLASWGYPRKLRKPRSGELESMIKQNINGTHAYYGDHLERKAETKRLHKITRAAGLSSSFESVAACVWRLKQGEMKKVKQQKKAKQEQKAKDAREREQEERLRANARKLKEKNEVVVDPMAPREMLVEHLERALKIAKTDDGGDWKTKYEELLETHQEVYARREALREQVAELKAKLEMIQEATQL